MTPLHFPRRSPGRARLAAFALATGSIVACDSPPTPPPRAPAAVPSAPVARGGGGERVTTGTGHSTGASYEAALDEPEDLSAVAGARELTDVELSQPMKRAGFLADCGVPDTMKIKVQVVVRDGAARGATVYTRPDDEVVAGCIDRAVRQLSWTSSKRRDSLTTQY